MWSIIAPGVARDVYGQLFQNGTKPDYREAARALHEAGGRLSFVYARIQCTMIDFCIRVTGV